MRKLVIIINNAIEETLKVAFEKKGTVKQKLQYIIQ